jgi:5-formyltetrahydrofolate cyclo-ligase
MSERADERKAALRRRLLAARAAGPVGGRQDADAAIAAHLDGLVQLRHARTVIAYAAFGAEVDLDPFLERLLARGVALFLPWVDGADLRIARVHDLEADLAPGWRGVREPRASGRREARPDRVDALLVPGVGFDPAGNRLGYGGGHFDRLLARAAAHATVVGVAYALQMAPRVPVEAHDRPVDLLVTERGVHRPPPRVPQ